MAAKKKGGNTVALVRRLAEPIARDLGLMLWDVRFVKEGADWFLRIFIDKPEGIGIEDCEAMSRRDQRPARRAGPDGTGLLPGGLLSGNEPRAHARRAFRGVSWAHRWQVKLIRPDEDGQRVIAGVLEDYRDSTVTLRDGGRRRDAPLPERTLPACV